MSLSVNITKNIVPFLHLKHKGRYYTDCKAQIQFIDTSELLSQEMTVYKDPRRLDIALKPKLSRNYLHQFSVSNNPPNAFIAPQFLCII